MPLGSSKFFKGKQPGKSTRFTGYPAWPNMPNVTVFTEIIEGFTSTGGPSNIHISEEHNFVPNVGAGSVGDNLSVQTTLNGNIYITTSAFGNQYGPLWAYNDESGNIANITVNLTNGIEMSGHSQILPNSRTGSHISLRRNSPHYIANIDLINGTTSASSNRIFITDISNLLISNPIMIHNGYSSNIILMRNGFGPTDANSRILNTTTGVWTENPLVPLSTTYGSGGPGLAAAGSPDTGRTYISGQPSGRFTFLDTTGANFIPSGGEIAFSETKPRITNGTYFATAQLGVDKNIYFLPYRSNHMMIYNPVSNTATTNGNLNVMTGNVTAVLSKVVNRGSVYPVDVYVFDGGHSYDRIGLDEPVTFSGLTDANITTLNGESWRAGYVANVGGYTLKSNTGNADYLESLVDSNITLTEGTITYKSSNVYVDSTLGIDGNIYAFSYSGNANSNVQALMSIDSKPDSPTYQQIKYYNIPGTTESSYIRYAGIGQSGEGTLLGIGEPSGMPGANVSVAKVTISGTGFRDFLVNPYINNGN